MKKLYFITYIGTQNGLLHTGNISYRGKIRTMEHISNLQTLIANERQLTGVVITNFIKF
jgi:hypothetical protein